MQERIQLVMLVSLAHYVSTLSLSAARQIVGVDTVTEKTGHLYLVMCVASYHSSLSR